MSPGSDVAWREDGVDRPSGHRRDDGLGGGVGGESLGDDPPVAQDRVRVADLQHLVESVRDVQDGHAAILQLAHGVKQRGRLRIGERGGGLVEDQDTTVVGERPGQGGHRPAHRTERRGVGADVDGVAELLEQRSGLVLEATPLDLTEARDESAAEEHVFGDGQSGNDHQLLVQRGDPLNGRRARAVDRHLGVVHGDLGSVRADDAGEDLDQGRLAGTVLAEQGAHLTGGDRHVDVVEHGDALVRLGESVRPETFKGGHRHG